jgi:hypothetical protein
MDKACGKLRRKKATKKKEKKKKKNIYIINDPQGFKSTFYKDLNRGPKNIWKLQTRKWWDPVNPSANFPTSFGLGRNQVTETRGWGCCYNERGPQMPNGNPSKVTTAQAPAEVLHSYASAGRRAAGCDRANVGPGVLWPFMNGTGPQPAGPQQQPARSGTRARSSLSFSYSCLPSHAPPSQLNRSAVLAVAACALAAAASIRERSLFLRDIIISSSFPNNNVGDSVCFRNASSVCCSVFEGTSEVG